MNTQQIEQRLKKLFNSYKNDSDPLVSELAKREYVFAELEKSDVLFIGINPSYLEGYDNIGSHYPIKDALVTYKKHYGKFQELATWGGKELSWTYIDLLAVRETKQAKVMQLLESESGLRFVVEQLKITREIIEYIQPKMIVVCNSGARAFLGIEASQTAMGAWQNLWLGYQYQFDDSFGVETIVGSKKEGISLSDSTNLCGVPCLFTSTLTYADANHKKRLAWQIHRTMKNYTACFGDAYSPGISTSKLLDQVAALAEELENTQTLKIKLMEESKYEQIARLSDKQRLVLKNLKDVLLSL